MGRRVKNQTKSWLEQTREDWRHWRNEIAKHSPQAKTELIQLEEHYRIKPLMEHPERYEGSRTQINEFMEALEDLKKGVLRERLHARGGESEDAWKARQKAQLKAPARKRGERKVRVKTGVDPKTGEKLAIIERAKKGEREIIESIRPGRWEEVPGTENVIGNVGGVVYKITRVKTQKGPRYQFNITKYGRKILPEPGAPPLYNHPDERKLFVRREDADVRARRVINAALIWYEEHRSQIKERHRIAGHRKQVHEKIQASRKPKISRELREAWEKRTGKGRKGRVDNPIFGGGGANAMLAQAKDALRNYKSDMASFQRSMRRGNPDYSSLMNAYDWLENARANFSLAEKKSDARAVQERKAEVRDAIISFMNACEVEDILEAGYRLNPSSKKKGSKKSKKRSKKNPSADTHQKIGIKFLEKSEKAWGRYLKSLKAKDLLDAYEDLILAHQELGYAGDKAGVAQAKAGLKAARAELASLKK